MDKESVTVQLLSSIPSTMLPEIVWMLLCIYSLIGPARHAMFLFLFHWPKTE